MGQRVRNKESLDQYCTLDVRVFALEGQYSVSTRKNEYREEFTTEVEKCN